MEKQIDLEKCPELTNWIGDKDGLLNAYIVTLQRTLPDLLSVQQNLEGCDPPDDFEAIGHAARVMGSIASDMKKISNELFKS